jgi:hypothetical protein
MNCIPVMAPPRCGKPHDYDVAPIEKVPQSAAGPRPAAGNEKRGVASCRTDLQIRCIFDNENL